MRDKDESYRHERLGLQFLHALRRGDAAGLADLWHQAETDPVLEALFDDLLAAGSDAHQDVDPEAACAAGDPIPLADSALPQLSRRGARMPPLPTVVVRHRLDDRTTDSDALANRPEESNRNVSSIKT